MVKISNEQLELLKKIYESEIYFPRGKTSSGEFRILKSLENLGLVWQKNKRYNTSFYSEIQKDGIKLC